MRFRLRRALFLTAGFGAVALWAGDAYRAVLARLASALLHLVGVPLQLVELDLLAPLDLALFAALAFSIVSPDRSMRVSRLILGLIAGITIELGTVFLWILIDTVAPRSLAESRFVTDLRGGIMATIAWVSPGLLAYLLFHPSRSSTARAGAVRALPSSNRRKRGRGASLVPAAFRQLGFFR